MEIRSDKKKNPGGRGKKQQKGKIVRPKSHMGTLKGMETYDFVHVGLRNSLHLAPSASRIGCNKKVV